MYKCKHFDIKELVSPAVYRKFGEFAWAIFDPEILKELDFIRDEWEKYLKAQGGTNIDPAIIINDWSSGGQYRESGYRCNVDSIVVAKKSPYLSGHGLAKGFDLKPKNKQYKEFYNFMANLISSGKLKKFKRLENISETPTWTHADCLQTKNDGLEIVMP